MRTRFVPCLAFFLATGSALAQEDPDGRARVPPDSSAVTGVDAYPDRWLGPDKAMHVHAGFWTAGAGYALGAGLDGDRSTRRASALVVGAVAGLAKETFDAAIQRERFSWKDLVADAVGIAALLGLTLAAE